MIDFSDRRLLLDWMREHLDSWEKNDLIYQRAGVEQMMFVRDTLASVFSKSLGEYRNMVFKISEHHSKSVLLPVYLIDVSRLRLHVVLRGNFYDWTISVVSEVPLRDCDFLDLVPSPGEKISPVYCQGFAREWCFGTFASNPNNFTCQLGRDYDVYTFCHILKTFLSRIVPTSKDASPAEAP